MRDGRLHSAAGIVQIFEVLSAGASFRRKSLGDLSDLLRP
jgi:hypothetical protein